MKKENKKYLVGVSLSALAFSLTYSISAVAQTCVTPPTCASLGYVRTQAECEGHSFVKCPFDTNFGYCDLSTSPSKKSCADGGYSSAQIKDCNCKTVNYEGLTCYSCTLKTCQELGYKDNLKGPGWRCTACPYDPTKFLCIAIPCPPGTRASSACTHYVWGHAVNKQNLREETEIYKEQMETHFFSGDKLCCYY